jgi:hypothetical protein
MYPSTAIDINTESGTARIAYAPEPTQLPSTIKDWELVYVRSACQPLDVDLTHQIALVEMRSCAANIKEANLQSVGAEHILLFDTGIDCDCLYLENWEMSRATLQAEDGQKTCRWSKGRTPRHRDGTRPGVRGRAQQVCRHREFF